MHEKTDKGAVGETQLNSCMLWLFCQWGILKYEVLEVLSCGVFLNVFFLSFFNLKNKIHPRAFIRKHNFVHRTVEMVCYILVGYETNSDIFFRLLVRFMITLFINEAQPLHHNFTFLHLSSFLRSYLSTYCCTFTCLSNRDSSWYVINYSFHYKSSILAKKNV